MNIKKIIIITLISLICLVPIKISYRDGGTIEYKALVYSVINHHSMRELNQYYVGLEVKILDFTVYENCDYSEA